MMRRAVRGRGGVLVRVVHAGFVCMHSSSGSCDGYPLNGGGGEFHDCRG